jgi:hypothetical protein
VFDIVAITIGVINRTCVACSAPEISFNAGIYLLGGGLICLILNFLIAVAFAYKSEAIYVYNGVKMLYSLCWGIVGSVLLARLPDSTCVDQFHSLYVMTIIYVVVLFCRTIAAAAHNVKVSEGRRN